MSGYFFKAAAAALMTVIVVGLFKRDNASLAMTTVTVAGILVLTFAALLLQPVLEQLENLAELADVSQAYLLPILKCVGIGIVTQIVVSLCQDAGESALGAALELCGCILVIYLSLPLYTAILELIEDLIDA